jgi:hypothetical protein
LDFDDDADNNNNNNNNNIAKRNAREERSAHSDVDDNADGGNNATITWRSLPLSQYKEFLCAARGLQQILLIKMVTTMATTATTAKLTKTTTTLLLAPYLPLILTELILALFWKIFS